MVERDNEDMAMGRVFFTNAMLLDGENAPQLNMTVVVSGNRITAVARDSEAPRPESEDQVIPVGGRTLMPGMSTNHFHPSYIDIMYPIEVDMRHPPAYMAYVAAKNAKIALMSGFTSAIGAGSPHNIDVSLRDAINTGLLEGPRLTACSVDMSTSGDMLDHHPYWFQVQSEGLARICDGPEDFRKSVRQFIKTGVDIIKIYTTAGHGWPGKNPPLTMSFEEQKMVVETAHQREVKVRSHTCTELGIIVAADAGVNIIDHGDELTDRAIEAMLKAESFLCPSIHVLVASEMRRRAGAQLEKEFQWVERAFPQWCEMLPKAQKAGVRILAGDDYGALGLPHGSYANEVEYFVTLGLSPLEAIKTVTRNAADAMDKLDDLGTIAAGKLADILVVNGDVLADVKVLQDSNALDVIMKDGAFVVNHLAQDLAASSRAHAA